MSEDKPLFVFIGNGPVTNLGCEAILRSTVQILQDEFGPCRFVNSPPRYFEPGQLGELGPDVLHAVPPRRVFPNRAWFEFHMRKRMFMLTNGRILLGAKKHALAPFLPAARAVFALGGDNFTLDYSAPWTPFALNRVALRYRKPVVIWGASVGPFDKNPKFERFAAQELSKASLICARESETVAYLKRLGLTHNVRLVADPAFTLEPCAVDIHEARLDVIEGPCIGMNISPLVGRLFWKGTQSWLDAATRNVKRILEVTGLPLLFVPHVVQPGNNDYDFMQQIMERLDSYRDRMAILKPRYDCRQVKWIISKMKLFIGARTHSTIAALSSTVPTISIGYSMKAKGINKDIFGHLDWFVPCEDLQGDALSETVERLLECEGDVRRYLEDFMPAYKQKARDAAKYVRGVI